MFDSKLVGDVSQLMVAAELASRGFNVLVPIGDRMPYDLLVDNHGRYCRIQVRTATAVPRWDLWQSNIKATEGMDLFVFVIQKERLFYIVPVEECRKLTTKISFIPHRKGNTRAVDTERYREAWQLVRDFGLSGVI
jgi:hypothetical protein